MTTEVRSKNNQTQQDDGGEEDLLDKFIAEHSKDIDDDDVLKSPPASERTKKPATKIGEDAADQRLSNNIVSVKEELDRRRKAYDKFLLQQTIARNADPNGEAEKKLVELENAEAKEKAGEKKPSQLFIHILFVLGILWFAMRLIGFDLEKLHPSSNARISSSIEKEL